MVIRTWQSSRAWTAVRAGESPAAGLPRSVISGLWRSILLRRPRFMREDLTLACTGAPTGELVGCRRTTLVPIAPISRPWPSPNPVRRLFIHDTASAEIYTLSLPDAPRHG